MKLVPAILALSLWTAARVSADDPRTTFPGSLAPVPAQARDLTASQPVNGAESVTFQIALRLQPDGKAPEADYQALVRWLQGQGLTVNAGAFPQHTEVEATGTVTQVSGVLGMRFGRIEINGRADLTGMVAPSLPAALGGAVIGINGLQPFLRKR